MVMETASWAPIALTVRALACLWPPSPPPPSPPPPSPPPPSPLHSPSPLPPSPPPPSPPLRSRRLHRRRHPRLRADALTTPDHFCRHPRLHHITATLASTTSPPPSYRPRRLSHLSPPPWPPHASPPSSDGARWHLAAQRHRSTKVDRWRNGRRIHEAAG